MLLFVIVLTLSLQPALGQQRCADDRDHEQQFNTFLDNHLENSNKNKMPNSKKIGDWQNFIDSINTWDRTGIQSFFPKSEHTTAIAVCSNKGKIVPNTIDQCISKEPINFYNVEVNDKKQVTKVKLITDRHVILGCGKVNKKVFDIFTCVPIHFEGNDNKAVPDDNQPDCSEKAVN